MIKDLDREHFLENLQNQMGWQGYSAAALENEIGVYSGYISRMKSDPQKLPALDIAWKMAQVLHVNLEWLLEGSIDPENRDGDFLYSFLERLFDLTHERRMRWTECEYGVINEAVSLNRMLRGFPFLEKAGDRDDSPVRLRSLCEPSFQVALMESAWSAPLDEHRKIWIVPLRGFLETGDEPPNDRIEEEWIELVLQDENGSAEPAPICHSMTRWEYLEPSIRKLLQEVQVCSRDLSLQPDVKSILTAFMDKTAGTKANDEKECME